MPLLYEADLVIDKQHGEDLERASVVCCSLNASLLILVLLRLFYLDNLKDMSVELYRFY